ncbi:GNAT family N-acetyltransferase [Yinghuangia seranimata]|uniref:GNAT family N-acetyltransferase n=1 Tax=Yinghuangia seranimata TaxID=408067 RepID=UPI00248AAFB7|nr:GNAT family N-acetyltransferase [Yinghuangia seranimata]MDI2129032.1 GNAT family N-acetyltransferase [Yinghuangia seranimata]
MHETITYVEMTAEADLRPSAPVAGLVLEQLDGGAPLIAPTLAGIGGPYGWKSASRTEEDWAAWFAGNPDRRFWLLSWQGKPAGLVIYDVRNGSEVEIETFGLLPEFVGKGLGGYALTLGIERAWRQLPEVSRVWLHTSSKDHPNALPNYQRRGFRAFRTEQPAPGDARA